MVELIFGHYPTRLADVEHPQGFFAFRRNWEQTENLSKTKPSRVVEHSSGITTPVQYVPALIELASPFVF